MPTVWAQLSGPGRASRVEQARGRLVAWDSARLVARATSSGPADSAPLPEGPVDERVWQLESVFTAEECVKIRTAVDRAAQRRGGWDRDRHGTYPTTDLPLSEVHDVEPLIRRTLFSRVLRPLMAHYLPDGYLPEHLIFQVGPLAPSPSALTLSPHPQPSPSPTPPPLTLIPPHPQPSPSPPPPPPPPSHPHLLEPLM